MTQQDADLRITLSASWNTDAANSYARSGIIRIADLFPAEVAEALHLHLDTEVEWGRVVSQGERPGI